jgi:hypothetical protein
MDKLVEVHFVRRYRQERRTCAHCGVPFEGPVLRRYCSVQCKQNAAWHRNGTKYRATVKAKKEREQ